MPIKWLTVSQLRFLAISCFCNFAYVFVEQRNFHSINEAKTKKYSFLGKYQLNFESKVSIRPLARNAFHIRVLNYGTIFRLKSNHQNLMKYPKNVSTMPTPNADSLFHVIVNIALICL